MKDLDYLKRFEGSYEATFDQQKIEITIKLCDSQLVVTLPRGELKLSPERFGMFSLKGVAGQKLQFIFDDSGNIVKAQMVLPNSTIAGEIMPKAQEQ